MIRNVGIVVANAAIAAGVFDIFENIGILLTLHGYHCDLIALLTFSFSITKWLFVVAAILYALIGAAGYLFGKKGKNAIPK